MAYDYGGGAYGGTGAGVGASLSPDDELDYHFGLTLEEWARDKPLSILQLDPADRAVLRIAGRDHHHRLFTIKNSIVHSTTIQVLHFALLHLYARVRKIMTTPLNFFLLLILSVKITTIH